MLELNEKEFFTVLKMLKRLKTGEYTRYELSGILDFSIYTKRFYSSPLFQKLKNEGTFELVKKQSNTEIYYFNLNKLRDSFFNSNVFQEALKFCKVKAVLI